jgi:uncharacterized protein YcbK (DUF882 family)
MNVQWRHRLVRGVLLGLLLLWTQPQMAGAEPPRPEQVTGKDSRSAQRSAEQRRERARKRARMRRRARARARARKRARMRRRARARARARQRARSRQRERRQRRRRSYIRMRARWHDAPSRPVRRRWLRKDPSPLVLRPVDEDEAYRLVPNEDGSFDKRAYRKARKALASQEGNGSHRIHPRLLRILYKAVKHFRTPYVHVVSGYRQDDATSRHTHGRAVDIVLPGVPDRRLAYFLSRQGFVGVGMYPVSGFVHLDLRNRSYFWMDRSAPGQASRHVPVLRNRGPRMDARARKRGVQPVEPLPGTSEQERSG